MIWTTVLLMVTSDKPKIQWQKKGKRNNIIPLKAENMTYVVRQFHGKIWHQGIWYYSKTSQEKEKSTKDKIVTYKFKIFNKMVYNYLIISQ